MICDANGGMCIAGVFGGLDSGVSDSTTNVFLESAYFNPVSIRKTARRHGLNTDASFRFERGVDPANTVYVLKRAALLIQEVAGGEISSNIIDGYGTIKCGKKPRNITFAALAQKIYGNTAKIYGNTNKIYSNAYTRIFKVGGGSNRNVQLSILVQKGRISVRQFDYQYLEV